MKALNFGISPCPNDTFIFGAWVQDLISVAPLEAGFFFADVDMLNRAVEARQPDICKVSVNMLPRISTEYVALRCGGAVGRGVGPVVVSRERLEPKDLDVVSVAVPGIRTTASLLLGLTGLHRGDLVEMEYNDIVDGVKWGEAEAGVLIHESRFTFEQEGLYKVMDLGEWWEQDT
ncbi:MAG: 1,4-dihydroxy-6-naphthoate synthase, partial [Desulfovibrio sp.]